MTNKTTSIVLLGITSDDKPHAARFDANDIATVVKAAQLMGLKIGRAETPEAQALVRGLPEGKLFASGKALVPLIKVDLYDRLLKNLALASTNGQPKNGEPATAVPPPDPAVKAATDLLWADIKVGSEVLVWFKDKVSVWWEAVVVSVSEDGDTLTMRWRDYPEDKKFTRKRHEVGLIGPGFKS